jgi:uncharacterized peroxidase-related enzyme
MSTRPNIPLLEKKAASAESVALLEQIEKGLGKIPNIFKAMAHSPTALGAYLALSGGIGKSSLTPRMAESIALAVAQANECGYCLSAHTLIGRMNGLSDEEMTAARTGQPADAKERAAVALAREIVQTRGHVGEAARQAARAAGLSDGQQLDVLVAVVLNVFTNYFNRYADTPIDFPKAPNLPE